MRGAHDPGVVLTGHVPDVGPHYAAATLAVAPLLLISPLSRPLSAAEPGEAPHPPVNSFTLDNGMDVMVATNPAAAFVAVEMVFRAGANVQSAFSPSASRNIT